MLYLYHSNLNNGQNVILDVAYLDSIFAHSVCKILDCRVKIMRKNTLYILIFRNKY